MNKKGFTLVELLGVLVILAIIALITTPIVINVVNGTKKNSNKVQKELIISYAKLWQTQYDHKISEVNGSVYKLTITELKTSGIIPNNDLVDIEKDQTMNNACVEITTKENGYNYEFIENC